jgi:beta-glucosidase
VTRRRRFAPGPRRRRRGTTVVTPEGATLPAGAPEARTEHAQELPGPRAVEAPGTHSTNFHFPPGFLWGAATSAHQVEGGNTLNDWWDWEQAGRVPQSSGAACDHWNRFREDFDLAHALRHNAHRFSVEWSRIEPEPGRFSDDAVAHYRSVIAALAMRGIAPVVTLHHYTLPRWLARRGGLLAPEFEERFERFVAHVAPVFAEQVRWWITFNEPVVLVYKSYLLGQWPPGHQSYPEALRAIRVLLRSHVRAYHVLKALAPDSRVGIAKHVLALSSCDPRNPFDRLSTRTRDFLFNELFVDALHTGALRVPGLYWERLGSGRTLDFIGLNYYTRDFVRNSGLDLPGLLGSACKLEHHQYVGKRNSLGWEIYPEGLGQFLARFRRFRLPLLITENGMSTERDEDRWFFLVLHLWQVARALGQGVPIVGYLYWSLLDNYEWANGYDARFGLIGVDYATQTRSVRESARRLADVIARNEL